MSDTNNREKNTEQANSSQESVKPMQENLNILPASPAGMGEATGRPSGLLGSGPWLKEIFQHAQSEADNYIAQVRAVMDEEHKAAGKERDRMLREQERLLSEAKSESERLLADAKLENERLISGAKAESEKLLADARSERDRLLTEGRTESERLLTEAKEERERLLTEAKTESARLMAEAEAAKKNADNEIRDKHAAMEKNKQAWLMQCRQSAESVLASMREKGDAILESVEIRLSMVERAQEGLRQSEARIREQFDESKQQFINAFVNEEPASQEEPKE